jgi:hypothetical protein
VLAAPDRTDAFRHRTGAAPPLAEAIPGFIGAELCRAPELFHQRGYLARVLTADPAGGCATTGSASRTSSTRRARCAGCDARGRRNRCDLPGHLLAHRRQGRRARD